MAAMVSCFRLATGEVLWSQKPAGKYFGSPVCVTTSSIALRSMGMSSYCGRSQVRALGVNPLGEKSHATPAVANGRMFLRTFSHLVLHWRAAELSRSLCLWPCAELPTGPRRRYNGSGFQEVLHGAWSGASAVAPSGTTRSEAGPSGRMPWAAMPQDPNAIEFFRRWFQVRSGGPVTTPPGAQTSAVNEGMICRALSGSSGLSRLWTQTRAGVDSATMSSGTARLSGPEVDVGARL